MPAATIAGHRGARSSAFPQPRFSTGLGQSHVAVMGSLHTVVHSTAFEIARNLTLFFVALHLARSRLLGVPRRAPADKDPWVSATADAARARAGRRAARLPALPAAGDARRCEGAAGRAPGARAAPHAAPAAMSGLPGGHRAVVPRLPRLHHAAEGAVLPVLGAPRAAVADLPLLRDSGGEPARAGATDLDSALTAEAWRREAFTRGNRPSRARRVGAS